MSHLDLVSRVDIVLTNLLNVTDSLLCVVDWSQASSVYFDLPAAFDALYYPPSTVPHFYWPIGYYFQLVPLQSF